MSYVPLRKAVERLGLHPNTLRKYADEGTIPAIKNAAGQRLFDVDAYKSAALQTGKFVLDVCEAYTSKTASWIGEMRSIGSAKVIRSGGFNVDRDLNGARGIFLRALVDTPSLRNLECANCSPCQQV